ncbi:hypothetical protein [Nocardia cyriacigeorgica]|uniref:Zinc-binding alcohol dehydrogenase family protein n=1 Tax=Nocardia cyriacigeorgica TaxID=135487 RepID=A0A4U8VVC8_9NOCA|nr:hypothetical protein [Nocardia cyriacigeorgica]MBF6160557.1 hypothetical protein [Nocardia cyriacigeorgica]MBF6199676.1 hypothetical protein [Nocardia cyriacigeorgica]MBF6320024.1 hypothetical protein [Nocardia cyriacigeorgica]MBF6517116.1 hypothetical protein [Nocardia cyriacigeorgica]
MFAPETLEFTTATELSRIELDPDGGSDLLRLTPIRSARDDTQEFLAAAGRHRIHLTTHPYPLDAADRALGDLAHERFAGAAVLVV